jgi:hypothetical protein
MASNPKLTLIYLLQDLNELSKKQSDINIKELIATIKVKHLPQEARSIVNTYNNALKDEYTNTYADGRDYFENEYNQYMYQKINLDFNPYITPKENVKISWKSVSGRKGIGEYIKEEDLFTDDDSYDFEHRRYIIHWEYVDDKEK